MARICWGQLSRSFGVLLQFYRVIVEISRDTTVDGQNPALPIIRNIP